MQRKTFHRTLLALAAAALLPLAAQAQTKLTLGHGAAPGNPRHEAALKFAEVAKAKSAGRIEVQVAPSAQLGDDAAMVTAMRTGALDMSANSQGAVANAVPEYAAYGMPFLFTTSAQAFKLLDGPLGKELADKSAEKGLVVLGYWDNGIRHMTNSKKPIAKVEDLKGLKMRTPPDSVLVDIMQSLGAEAQQIKFAELYVALQQGVVDGQENPLMNIHASKLYEVQKHSGADEPPVPDDAAADEQAQLGQALRGRPQGGAGSRRRGHRAAAQAVAGVRRQAARRPEGQGRVGDDSRQSRFREGHRRGRCQVAGAADRAVREEGDHRGPRPVS